jgi:hypothetical protein
MSGSDYTLTPNLGLFKPNYNADVDNWGFHLNDNCDTLDALLGSATAGPFLPLSGGTLAGTLIGTVGTFATVQVGSTGGPTWTTGSAAPTATAPVGSLYSCIGGAVGATLYVSRGGGTWAAVAGV